jgi:hypothetical protein
MGLPRAWIKFCVFAEFPPKQRRSLASSPALAGQRSGRGRRRWALLLLSLGLDFILFERALHKH